MNAVVFSRILGINRKNGIRMDEHHGGSIKNYFLVREAFGSLTTCGAPSTVDFTRVGDLILKHSPKIYVAELRTEMAKMATGLGSIADSQGVKYDGRSVHVRTMDDRALYY